MSDPAVVAFCPSPPLLLPAVGVGPDGALEALRTRCHEAVSALIKPEPGIVVIVGATGTTADETAGGSFAPWGVDVRVGGSGQPTLSLPHAIGAWLLDEAGWTGPRRYAVPDGPTPVPADDAWALLVVADGSVTRTPKAPGAFDPEGEVFDATVAAALASGQPARLAELVAPVRIQAQGVPAWHLAARLMGERTYDARVLADTAPYGVGYVVATWSV
jgi:hypothetical protein